ncbi:T9SS type A sorting domain-containing protein [bacterium AH-315-B15]|nr:T9SS type A sorting domain-containing protein [bacterium AH-315-B15]
MNLKIVFSLVFFTTTFSYHVRAQVQSLELSEGADIEMPAAVKGLTGGETLPSDVIHPQPIGSNQKAVYEEMIGETVYDLLTNSSIQNRNIVHADGTIGAVFTYGWTSPSFPDRGTGYNYFSSGIWAPMPGSRIETTRNGWPSLMSTNSGSEIVISHTTAGSFTMNKRNPKGSGVWTESIVPSTIGEWLLWPRATAGGASGDAIHLIGMSAPVANGGVIHEGIDGALMYYRSLDEGVTWDIVDSILPGLDSLNFNHFRADSYSIISEGDDVAIAIFNQWADMVLMRSADNGSTWTTQLINDFPLDLYVTDQPNGSDWTGDLVPDTISTCDESGAMIFDAAGNVHITFGHMRVLDADLTDGNTSYFPGTQELYYWNESMASGSFVTIAVPEDVNEDGVLDFVGYAAYYTALCGFPSMGTTASGTIYVSYAGYMENFATATQNYRHIYVLKSTDGGTSWSTPLDVTPDLDEDYYECVFPTMASNVDDKVRLHYMRDWEPGLAARGDLDPYGVNSIMYLEVDSSLIDDVGLDQLKSEVKLDVFPNPSDFSATLRIELKQSQYVSVFINNIAGVKLNFNIERELKAGDHSYEINTEKLAAGIYFITVETDGISRTKQLVVQH